MDRRPDDAKTKLDLPFILNASARTRGQAAARAPAARSPSTPAAPAEPRPPLSREEKKKKRECTVDGCHNYIVHKGLCCRHGGGKKCAYDGCSTSAKHNGLCWKHGGSVLCKVDKCTRKAKARGLCWAHGGGTRCQHDECAKVAVSNGFCWAHGGGKRCGVQGCIKPAYERTGNLCPQHFEELSGQRDFPAMQHAQAVLALGHTRDGEVRALGQTERAESAADARLCGFQNCMNPGYERTNNLCPQHFDELSRRQDRPTEEREPSQQALGWRQDEDGAIYIEL